MKLLKQQLMQYRLLRAHALGVREYNPTRYEAEMALVMQERAHLEELLATLEDPRQRTVMQLRYLHGMAWQDIAEQMFYSLRWVMKLHRAALAELGGIL